MRGKIFRATALALVLVLGAGLVTMPALAAGPAKKITFLTNFIFNGRHAPFFVGVEQGYYRDAGFDVTISPASGSGFVVTAVDNGKAEYGLAETSSVIQAVANGVKVKGFLVYMDVTTSGLASLRPYDKPESLKGKKVAAAQTDSARVTMPIILSMHHLDLNSIDWIAADPGVYLTLLLNGQVDLFSAASDGGVPALRKVASKQGKTVYFSSFADWGYDALGYFLIASGNSLSQHPDDARNFAAATTKAVMYSIAHPEEAARIIVKDNPTLDYDTILAQWHESMVAIQTDYAKKHGYGTATPDRLQSTIDLTKQAMKLDVKLAPADIYTPVMAAK